MADAAERYIERRELLQEQERLAQEILEATENQLNEAPRPRRNRSMRTIHREFVESLKVDRAIAKGNSLRKSIWARPWTAPKIDRKAKRIWQSAKKVEFFDTFISHVWSTRSICKFISLLLQSCWIFMLTSWVIVVAGVFVLCFFDFLPLGWRYDAEALGEVVACHLGLWIVGFSMPACLLLGAVDSEDKYKT